MYTKFFILTVAFLISTGIFARGNSSLPMNKVYQGPVRLPDFKGIDREYSGFRTRIKDEMKTGPNFAGHYAIIVIGCGTGCTFGYIADVATGRVVARLPLGGEDAYMKDYSYNVKSNILNIDWVIDVGNFDAPKASKSFTWDGTRFKE